MLISLSGSSALWVEKMAEECLDFFQREGFFRKLRMDNKVLNIQCQVNSKGCFLQLAEFGNGRRRGFLVIPEGSKGNVWEGFAYYIRLVVGFKAPIFENANRVKVSHPQHSLFK